jgi:hypothetical protein
MSWQGTPLALVAGAVRDIAGAHIQKGTVINWLVN